VRDSLVRGEGAEGENEQSRKVQWAYRVCLVLCMSCCSFVVMHGGRTGNVCMHACSAPSCGTSYDKAEGLFFFA
jgi:hypothetical protein